MLIDHHESLKFKSIIFLVVAWAAATCRQSIGDEPVRKEVISPIHLATFDNNGKCQIRKQGGNPRTIDNILIFDGSTDGNRQVDPQIAVGGGFVLHATNQGLVIYDKNGQFVRGVRQSCFNGGIDPKLFYDPHNEFFGFDLWNPWDKAEQKPVNISVSETNDPRGAWNTYPVPAPEGRDGGAIGFSKKWIGYSFPGGKERTFVMVAADAKAGKPVSVYHFNGSLGLPVFNQDDDDHLYFVSVTNKEFGVTRIVAAPNGEPRSEQMGVSAHNLEFTGHPPRSPQKGTKNKTASGDRRPKNLVLQNGHIWFSRCVNVEGRSAVQWHQIQLDGTIIQSGLIRHPTQSYIQTTIAVNKNEDVLIGFQETGPDSFISPRFAFRRKNDRPGTLGPIVGIGEGRAATQGSAWGDYSGSCVDGDNHLDLWTIQSVADETGRGDTVIAKIRPADADFKSGK